MKQSQRKTKSYEMAGRLPHFIIARTVGGDWCAYKLTTAGHVRLTLSRYSPADAAESLTEVLRTQMYGALGEE